MDRGGDRPPRRRRALRQARQGAAGGVRRHRGSPRRAAGVRLDRAVRPRALARAAARGAGATRRRRLMPLVAWRFVRLAVRLALLGVLLASVYVAVVFVQVWQASRVDDRRPGQAIVVLGAEQDDGRPSPVLAARLDHALLLWHAHVAPVIVVTGGKQPGDRFTEAEASAAYLHARGVPQAALLREVQGRSSWESLQA